MQPTTVVSRGLGDAAGSHGPREDRQGGPAMISREVSSRSSGIKISRAISIDGDADRVAARQQGAVFAVGLGFSPSEATTVATAISELAGKILVHAARGEITLSAMSHGVPPALTVTARGEGEGVADGQRAIRDRYSHGAASATAWPVSSGSSTVSRSSPRSARAQSPPPGNHMTAGARRGRKQGQSSSPLGNVAAPRSDREP